MERSLPSSMRAMRSPRAASRRAGRRRLFDPSVTESSTCTRSSAPRALVVVGTTGWTEESLRARPHVETPGVRSQSAENFAMGAVLAMKFAAMATPCFESAEVIGPHRARSSNPLGHRRGDRAKHREGACRQKLGEMPMPPRRTSWAAAAAASMVSPRPCRAPARPDRLGGDPPGQRGRQLVITRTPSTACPSCPASCWVCAA